MYVAILRGTGEGCDYTIGCNVAVEYLEAITYEKAEQAVVTLIKSYGEDRVESVQLLNVQEKITFKTKDLIKKPSAAEVQRQRDEEEFERLKKKLKKDV